jgi:hypothetical protein
MLRRTKIVATLGPASNSEETIGRLIEAGMDVVRLNLSHGVAEEHAERVELVRSLARAAGHPVGVIADLQGPKIRVGKFEQGKVTLKEGSPFVLDAECALGDSFRVGLDYKQLPADVSAGDTVLLDDGRIVLSVAKVQDAQIFTKVERGGVLSNNKGINRRGGGLTAPALTEKDQEDIKAAALFKADYLAVSFPRSGADMEFERQLMHDAGGKGLLLAKIERAEAIAALEETVDASDAIMVARGDLAVEMRDAAVPALPKRMIRQAREVQAGDHRNPDDGVHDFQPDPHPGLGIRRGERRPRRYRCGDALGRNSGGTLPGRNRRRHGARLSGRGAEHGEQRRPGSHGPRVHAHRPVGGHGCGVHRVAPERQGDRRPDPFWVHRPVDLAGQPRGAHLRAPAGVHP